MIMNVNNQALGERAQRGKINIHLNFYYASKPSLIHVRRLRSFALFYSLEFLQGKWESYFRVRLC